jgi:hypothetical protein
MLHTKGATVKQIEFIFKLVSERELVGGIDEEMQIMEEFHDGRGSLRASQVIDYLLKRPLKASAVATGGATPKQREFINKLLAERLVDGDTAAYAYEAMEKGTSRTASQIIDLLLQLPPKVHASSTDAFNKVAAWPAIPDGRHYYAVVIPDDQDQALRFFRVTKPTEGKYVGRIFVDSQASGDFWKVDGLRKEKVLATISENPQQAMATYGIELGHCGACGKTLTDQLSRELGIGPKCRGDK